MKKPKKPKIVAMRFTDMMDFINQFADYLVERHLEMFPEWDRERLMRVAGKIMAETKQLELPEVIILHLQMVCAHVKTCQEIMQCHSHQIN